MNATDSFLEACAEGDLNQAKFFLPYLETIDVRSNQGWTGLIIACHGEHHALAKWLILQGADVNATNRKGTTVFMYAKTPIIRSLDTTFLDYLIKRGADPNAQDSSGQTALDYVKRSNRRSPLVQYLKTLKKN